jgi:myosin heavy chain 9/10/11/14
LQVEREKATWSRQLDALKSQLETEASRRAHLEKNQTGRNTEAARLRERVTKMEKDMVNLQKDIGDRDWQIRQLKANQNKTIVEHVHVLQEAKRVTDGQLEDAQRDLAKERAKVQLLEKTRARMIGEAEDAARAHEQELIALRSNDKNARLLEQRATKAITDMERERKLREVSEMQAKRLQGELQTAQGQASDLERNLHTVQRAKDTLESEIASLAADGDSANSMRKMRRDYETRITQLEAQVEDAEVAKTTAERIKQKIDQQHAEIRRLITSSGPRDNFRERLLKELQNVDDALAAEFPTRALRSGKRNSVQTFANLTPSKRISMPPESNGLARSRRDSQPIESPRTPDKNSVQLKQQVNALELRIVASDRVRQHLEAALKELTTDLQNSDGSKQSLNAHRAKISRENSRLAALLNEEAEARRAAEASQMDGINTMWKKFQATIDGERDSYTKLEESRKALASPFRYFVNKF